MKNFSLKTVTMVVALLITSHANSQIAAGYNGDSGILGHPDVIFVEMFEGSVSTLTTSGNYWDVVSPNPANILPDPSVPNGSQGNQSLRLRTIQDGTNPNQNTLVYKKLSPDITDSVFVRYYIKYDTNTRYHHSGLWVGGKNPPSSIPGNIGGTLPLGNQEFHVGTEVRGTTPSNNTLFGFYNYWMGMNPHTTGPYAGSYHGNEFLNSTTNDNISMNSWNCIEIMIKLNTPVTAKNGELALWVNGIKISHHGFNFPNGNWNETQFTEGVGIPFEGFQFRNDNALNLNYIWLRNFNDQNVTGHVGNIYFDHLVVAKNYIGPMGSSVGMKENNVENEISVFPNPSKDKIKINIGTQKLEKAIIYNLAGQSLIESDQLELSTSDLDCGMYFISIQTDSKTYVKKIIKE